MSIYIKNVELKSNVILAPMAGFTDFAFRKMCLDYGAGLVCTEMVSAQALHYKNEKTESLLYSFDDESPKAVQIFEIIGKNSYKGTSSNKIFFKISINNSTFIELK